MTPSLEQAVKHLITQYGTSILSEPRRLQAMLQDTYNGNRREVRLMMTIAEEGVLSELLRDSSQQVEKQVFARLSNRLHQDTGMDVLLIDDALTSWIHILDKTPPPRVQQSVVTQQSSGIAAQQASVTQQSSSIPAQHASITQQSGSIPAQQASITQQSNNRPNIQSKAQAASTVTRSFHKQTKQQSIPIWKLVIAMLIAVALIKLFTPWLDGDSSNRVASEEQSLEATTATNQTVETNSDQADMETTSVATNESIDTQDSASSISYEQMSSFMTRYNKLGVEAINTNDFSLVEPFLDKSGKSYTEQSDYIAYLNRKGIREQSVGQQIRKVTKIDSTTYEVKTYEAYNIYYSDGTGKFKSFNSSYTVKVINGQLAVRSLDQNTEIESRDL